MLHQRQIDMPLVYDQDIPLVDDTEPSGGEMKTGLPMIPIDTKREKIIEKQKHVPKDKLLQQHAFGTCGGGVKNGKARRHVNHVQYILTKQRKLTVVGTDTIDRKKNIEHVESGSVVDVYLDIENGCAVNSGEVSLQKDSFMAQLLTDLWQLFRLKNGGGGWLVLTNILYDSGANISLARYKSDLSNPHDVDLGGAGINGSGFKLECVGAYGDIDKCYFGSDLKKPIIPPQKAIEATDGKVMLLHLLVQQRPPIHAVIGIVEGKIEDVYAIASPLTNGIMVWTSSACKYLHIKNYETIGKIKATEINHGADVNVDDCSDISMKFGFEEAKNNIYVNSTDYTMVVNHAKHMDRVDQSKLIRDMLMGKSTHLMKNIRMVGVNLSKKQLEMEDRRLAVTEKQSNHRRTSRRNKADRVVPLVQCEPLAYLLVDAIFFAELESTGFNKSFKSYGGYFGVVLVMDAVGKGSWLVPIRTQKHDYHAALRTALIKIRNFGKAHKWKLQYIKADKAANQSPKSMESICHDFQIELVPVVPGNKGLKLLDRRVVEIRAGLNHLLAKCHNLLEYTHVLIVEANRRLFYISSANGKNPSPYEFYFRMLPTLDHLYPPVGCTVITKSSINDKIGAAQGILLGHLEDQGAYVVYFPRADTVLTRLSCIFITEPRPYDGLLRMMMGQRLYDETKMINGHVAAVSEDLHGQRLTKVYNAKNCKGYWAVIILDHNNHPIRGGTYGCGHCSFGPGTLKQLVRHWNDKRSEFKSAVRGSHPDPSTRPKALCKTSRERAVQYKKVKMDELVKNPPKKSMSSMPKLLGNKSMTTQEFNYQLRTRTVTRESNVKKKQMEVELENKAKFDATAKETKSIPTIAKLGKVIKNVGKLIKCPHKGCLEMLKLTKTGRNTKAAKQHMKKHEIADNDASNIGRPRRKTADYEKKVKDIQNLKMANITRILKKSEELPSCPEVKGKTEKCEPIDEKPRKGITLPTLGTHDLIYVERNDGSNGMYHKRNLSRLKNKLSEGKRYSKTSKQWWIEYRAKSLSKRLSTLKHNIDWVKVRVKVRKERFKMERKQVDVDKWRYALNHTVKFNTEAQLERDGIKLVNHEHIVTTKIGGKWVNGEYLGGKQKTINRKMTSKKWSPNIYPILKQKCTCEQCKANEKREKVKECMKTFYKTKCVTVPTNEFLAKEAERINEVNNASLSEWNKTHTKAEEYNQRIDEFFEHAGSGPAIQMAEVNACRIMFYGEENIDQQRKIGVDKYATPYEDPLPSCEPMEKPYVPNYQKMLAQFNIEDCFDKESKILKEDYILEVNMTDDAREDFVIPEVRTANVTVDPDVETGLMGRYKFRQNLKKARREDDQFQSDKNMKDRAEMKEHVHRWTAVNKEIEGDTSAEEIMEDHVNDILDTLTYANYKHYVPKNYKEMIQGELMPGFIDAAKTELKALSDLGAWVVEKLPEGKIPINTRMVFDLKWSIEHGRFERFKCRLCAQGFRQIAYDSYDPDQISSPVMTASSLNAILIMASKLNLKLNTLDVKNAFITAKLDDKIWIKLPAYCKVMDGDIKLDTNVLLLKSALYGLKNSSKCFFNSLKKFLTKIGFIQSDQDPCVFTYMGEHGYCILGCHVDDILSASSDGFFETYLCPQAEKEFEYGVTKKDATQFLGCMIEQNLIDGKPDPNNSEIAISQRARVERIAEMFNITKQEQSPLPTGAAGDRIFAFESISQTDAEQEQTLKDIEMDKDLPTFVSYSEVTTYYRSYTGNLVYLTCYGRPDVQAIVYKLARYQQYPSLVHIRAVRHLVGYLLRTKNKRLIFGRQQMKDTLCCFSDASYADCTATARSTGGYVHFLFGSYLSSRSFKINCVTRSVTAAEFYTLSAAAADSIYFRDFYNDTLRPLLMFAKQSELVKEATKGNDTVVYVPPVERVPITHSGFKQDGTKPEILLSAGVHPWSWMDKEDTVIYGDNKSSLNQANNGSNKRSKHIKIHNSYVWEQIHVFKTVRVGKVHTKENCADMQTKMLDETLFEKHAGTIMGSNEYFEVNYTQYIDFTPTVNHAFYVYADI